MDEDGAALEPSGVDEVVADGEELHQALAWRVRRKDAQMFFVLGNNLAQITFFSTSINCSKSVLTNHVNVTTKEDAKYFFV
jgi:hypothetical protein